VLTRLQAKGFVLAQGDRSVAAERISGSTIVTGDGNTVISK